MVSYNITVTINTANDAFKGCAVHEIERCLMSAARKIKEDGLTDGAIRKLLDTNGNTVGLVSIERE